MQRIRPLHDRVVVKRIAQAEKSKGGIFIPDAAKEKPQEGIVVAVGPGRTHDNGVHVPMPIQIGDRILFGKYNGIEFKLDDVEHVILGEGDIHGILEN